MSAPVASVTDAISYDDLYARWERGNWRATEIDFSQDRIDWHERLTEEQRRSALWLYTLFFHGEDSVTDNLSPYIDAAPLEEQKYFLTTQQVDEARHAVFFKRFMHEVVGAGDGTLAGGLQATADQITWGHHQVFSRLDRMADELRRDRSKPKLAAAVTLYHLVVEASLAQPGQHMIEASLEQLDVLPGFREGMRNVSLDEQRHIGFGVKLLADLYREDPGPIQDAIVGLIKEVLPWTSAVAKPPNWDRSYTECFGFTLEDLGEAGATSIEQRLRAVGLPVDTIPGFPMPMDLPPRERAVRGQKLLRAGLIGPGDDGVVQDPEAIEIMFDTIRRGAVTDGVRPGHDDRVGLRRRRALARRPRQRRLAGGGRGRAAHADLTLRAALRRLGRCHGRPRGSAGADAAAAAAAEGEPAGAAGAAEGLRLSLVVRVALRGAAQPGHRGRGQPPALAEGANQPAVVSGFRTQIRDRFGRSPAARAAAHSLPSVMLFQAAASGERSREPEPAPNTPQTGTMPRHGRAGNLARRRHAPPAHRRRRRARRPPTALPARAQAATEAEGVRRARAPRPTSSSSAPGSPA